MTREISPPPVIPPRRAAIRTRGDAPPQVGDLMLDENGLARRGLLVRHLVLPGDRASTEAVLAFLAREISTDTYLNLMDQYHPCYKSFKEPPLGRSITPQEYEQALWLAASYGLRRLDRPRRWPR